MEPRTRLYRNGLFVSFLLLSLVPFSAWRHATAQLRAETDGPKLQTKAEPLNSGFFFGETAETKDSNKEEEVYESAFREEGESSGVLEEDHSGQDRWVDEDISPMFPELKVIDELSTKHSLKRMRAARRYYSLSKRSIQKSRAKAAKLKASFSLEGVRYDWEKVDRKANLKRRERRVLHRGRLDSISYLIKGIRELDSVRNPSILKSDSYISLKSNMYRAYVKQQFLNRNLNLCIDILQRYMQLKPEHKQEPEVHRLLAASYRSQELLAERARDFEARIRFKKKKNRHLISYALLAYGKDSPQYRFIKKRVDQDMMDVPPDNSSEDRQASIP